MKAILLILIVFFLLFRLGGFFLRSLFGQGPAQTKEGERSQKFTPRDGNVTVDYTPDDKKNKKKDFDGGEYVEYEEVK